MAWEGFVAVADAHVAHHGFPCTSACCENRACAEYMKSKPPNSESKILYLRPFKAYNMLRIS